jgi:hypothetical protein
VQAYTFFWAKNLYSRTPLGIWGKKMEKQIIIGSLVAVVITVLMPIVPAININAIENQIKTEYEELLLEDDIDIKIPDKFPLLYILVITITISRNIRGELLWELAFGVDDFGINNLNHPYLLLRSLILVTTVDLGIIGWYLISEILGWEWDFGLE